MPFGNKHHVKTQEATSKFELRIVSKRSDLLFIFLRNQAIGKHSIGLFPFLSFPVFQTEL
jgi:hypothetical protein